MMRQVLLLTSVAAVAACQSGCVFFQKEYFPGVDPEARSFVFVHKVRGNTLILREGNSVTLAPLSMVGMSEFQRDRLAMTLKGMAPYHKPIPRKGGAYPEPGLLVRNSMEPKEVLLSIPYVPLMRICSLRIRLFPIRIKVPPAHIDVIEYVLKAGMAKLDPKAIPDPTRHERYLKAEDSARTLGLGVWGSLGEQLLEAVAFGNTGEVERLLNVGASTDYVGQACPVQANAEPPSLHLRHPLLGSLWWARSYRHQGRTPLMVAARGWQREIARILLRHGADVNMPVRDAKRPSAPPIRALHCAAQVYCFDPDKRLGMLKMLVEAGADVRAADADRRLIGITMFSTGQWDVIGYLHSTGASIEVFDPKKHGPDLLACAAPMGKVSDMARLIEFGADVNGLSQFGYPLSMAARAGHLEAVKLLLDAGADPNRKDSKGRTPLQYAKSRRKNTSMIALLTQRGAK